MILSDLALGDKVEPQKEDRRIERFTGRKGVSRKAPFAASASDAFKRQVRARKVEGHVSAAAVVGRNLEQSRDIVEDLDTVS